MHITTTTTTTRRLLAAALAVAVAGGAAACSDDAEAATLSTEACKAATAYSAAIAGMPQDPAAMGGYVTEEIIPVVTSLVDGLPDDVDAGAFTAALETVADTGDPGALFGDPDAAEAQTAVGAAVHAGCDFTTVDVTAKDYSFDGLPAELEPGATSIRFENAGSEEHELVLFRLADGVEADAEALLSLPEEEQMEKLAFSGVVFAGPNTTSYGALDLEPGTYLAVCFVPVGGAEDGAPHFVHGMHATFTVAE
jgi:hypothetical protein